jgi:hypothetical protein
MTPDKFDGLLARRARVRVWDAQRASVFTEGEVVGFIVAPTIIVQDDSGRKFYHSTELPIDELHTEWRRV